MKILYEIDCGVYSQKYFIVASSYAKAEKIWYDKYKESPKGIKQVTPYILVEED